MNNLSHMGGIYTDGGSATIKFLASFRGNKIFPANIIMKHIVVNGL